MSRISDSEVSEKHSERERARERERERERVILNRWWELGLSRW
jgi:hypothetical protein